MQSFRYINKLLPTKTMKDLYYTHAYPHLIGAITIWGTDNDRKTYIQPLIRTQKRLIRLITNKPPKTHTAPIMSDLSILNLKNLYILRVCAEMHPFIHPRKQLNRPEHDHHYTLTAQIHRHTTRHSLQKRQYTAHTTEHYTKKYARVWNSIPLELREIKGKKAYKISLNREP